MANNYCYENLNQLRNNGYVNGELIYLQRLNVETDFPMKLRLYNFCTKCGVPINEYPNDNNAQYLAFKNGTFNGIFGRMTIYGRTANENQYTFNLVAHNKILTLPVGHPNWMSGYLGFFN
ncbi:MAG: hypothetical protein WA667_18085 [Candidatus Nitrosopolaris sp.]